MGGRDGRGPTGAETEGWPGSSKDRLGERGEWEAWGSGGREARGGERGGGKGDVGRGRDRPRGLWWGEGGRGRDWARGSKGVGGRRRRGLGGGERAEAR